MPFCFDSSLIPVLLLWFSGELQRDCISHLMAESLKGLRFSTEKNVKSV